MISRLSSHMRSSSAHQTILDLNFRYQNATMGTWRLSKQTSVESQNTLKYAWLFPQTPGVSYGPHLGVLLKPLLGVLLAPWNKVLDCPSKLKYKQAEK